MSNKLTSSVELIEIQPNPPPPKKLKVKLDLEGEEAAALLALLANIPYSAKGFGFLGDLFVRVEKAVGFPVDYAVWPSKDMSTAMLDKMTQDLMKWMERKKVQF